jgi:GNAT superfamily N-acetyltransferase
MPHVPVEVLNLAEDLNAHMPQRKGDRRLVTTRYVIAMAEQPGPHATVVQRLRLVPDEVDEVVAEIRAFLRREGRAEATWEVGQSATPGDLLQRLKRLGMVPFEQAPHTTGMVFTASPEAPPSWAAELPGVTVTLVGRDDRAGFRRAQRVFWACFGFQPETDVDGILDKDAACYAASPHWQRFVAWQDGEPLAVGDAVLTPAGVVLCGGATLPDQRGRGLYRVLLAARLREALAHGVPRLITQAGRMSQPILARLGFQAVASIDILYDRQAL